jgi:pSer/pThr/pTyr-binding forkhead associated (FHA) protein
MGKLIVISGPAAGRSIPLDRDVVIGREGADLTIPDPELSRRHAIVRPGPGGVVVEDLGSTNGTRVAGTRIERAVTITSPTTIEIGTTTIQLDIPTVQTTRLRDRPIADAGQATRVRKVPDPQVTRAAAQSVQPAPSPGPSAASPPEAPPPPPAPSPAAATPPPPASPPSPAAESAPPAAPPAAPPGPTQPGVGPPARGRRPSARVIAAVLVVVAVIAGAVIAIAATRSGSSATTHTLNASIQTMALSDPRSTSISGVLDGPPVGRVSVIFQRLLDSIPKPGGGPSHMKLLILISTEKGLILVGARGTVELSKSGAESVRASGIVSRGTGTFNGATGQVNLVGGHTQPNSALDSLKITGKLKY